MAQCVLVIVLGGALTARTVHYRGSGLMLVNGELASICQICQKQN